jgi:hypothetical protein
MSTTVRRTATAVLATCLLLAWSATPTLAAPQGYIEDELGVGFFYGTFNQDPDIILLAGGTAEEFCEDNPDDPFNAEPGIAPLRVFPRPDGSVDLKVNAKDQPIYLYYSEIGDGPTWIAQVCQDYFADGTAPGPFASGTADLKVRISVVSEDLVDVFNSVNGTAIGTDGTEYKVRASADLVVENGVPQGDPAEFVDFQLTEIRR